MRPGSSAERLTDLTVCRGATPAQLEGSKEWPAPGLPAWAFVAPLPTGEPHRLRSVRGSLALCVTGAALSKAGTRLSSECPLLARSGRLGALVGMSAEYGKADESPVAASGPLLTHNGQYASHTTHQKG
jgi:hypothetical protein